MDQAGGRDNWVTGDEKSCGREKKRSSAIETVAGRKVGRRSSRRRFTVGAWAGHCCLLVGQQSAVCRDAAGRTYPLGGAQVNVRRPGRQRGGRAECTETEE